MSGRHVLLGHLTKLAEWSRAKHEYLVLFHPGNRDLCRHLGENVQWHVCPSHTAHWTGRSVWEVTQLSKLARRSNVDFVFSPAGTVVPGLSMPQVAFAQNPWAMVAGLQVSVFEKLKASMQRHNYSAALSEAVMMIYNSEYMRCLYQQNAGSKERASSVVYQAIDDETHAAATGSQGRAPRKALQVLCVSAMAPHKGVETLVSALAQVRERHGIPAHLVIAGPWPDKPYRKKIDKLIAKLDLDECIDIKGHVSREDLHNLYAESKVFSLMSRCESFGIPAVEAQAFGTPVVSSDCCAIPEVCGQGGQFFDQDDVDAVALALTNLLTNSDDWERLSKAARENASRFRWDLVSRGMLEMFDHV